MARTPLPITNGFYMHDSLPISAQECVNWYPRRVEVPGLVAEWLFGTPGGNLLTPGQGIREVNRGSRVMAEIPYFVNGKKLYRLDRTISGTLESFDVTLLGAVDGTGRVSVADNGTQLCILVPGGKGYIFTANPDTFTEITDPDFRANGNPQHVVFIDGYFLFTTDTKKFIISALNNGLAYNALDVGTAESDPDVIVAPFVYRNELYIGGSVTLEGFQNIGGPDFPFRRTGVFIDTGVSAPFSVSKIGKRIMFIGAGKDEGPAVWELQSNDTVKVSTDVIDSMLQKLTDTELSQVFSWSYAKKGAYFIGFTLPDTTVVYDVSMDRWHERKSQIVSTSGVALTARSRINSIVSAYGRLLVGDSQDGRIGEISTEVYTDYDAAIIRRVATQPFQNNMQSFSVPYLELTVESGVGNSAVPDPVIMMDRSLDGKTFKDQRTRRIGKIGEYGHRAIWNRNGRAKRLEIFRFTLTDAVKPVIIQLTADVV